MKFAIALSSILSISSAFGHEDPWGDVHPTIRVQNGEFVVWFQNVTPLPEGDGKGNYHRRTGIRAMISPDGANLLNRRVVEESPPFRREVSQPIARIDGGLGVAADWQNGAQDVGGFCETEDALYFHMSPFAGGDAAPPMYLGKFSLAEKRLTSWARVGFPGRIYHFAVASRVVYSEGHVYVAWIEERDRKAETVVGGDGTPVEVVSAKHQVVLTKWKVGQANTVHLPIRQTLGDNSHLDIEVWGNKLLIAWHEGIGLFGSRIGTALVDLSKAPFKETIHFSPVPTIHQARLQQIEDESSAAEQSPEPKALPRNDLPPR